MVMTISRSSKEESGRRVFNFSRTVLGRTGFPKMTPLKVFKLRPILLDSSSLWSSSFYTNVGFLKATK